MGEQKRKRKAPGRPFEYLMEGETEWLTIKEACEKYKKNLAIIRTTMSRDKITLKQALEYKPMSKSETGRLGRKNSCWG
jgi:hypothetical protein